MSKIYRNLSQSFIASRKDLCEAQRKFQIGTIQRNEKFVPDGLQIKFIGKWVSGRKYIEIEKIYIDISQILTANE